MKVCAAAARRRGSAGRPSLRRQEWAIISVLAEAPHTGVTVCLDEMGRERVRASLGTAWS
jgi:hypothetical protein